MLDFHTRKVYPWQGEEYDYFFRFDPALIESLIVRHVEDWINELFLSCRFQAERKGAYNEYVYNFFKCLSMERLQYAEGYYAEKAPVQTLWESNGYRIQRRCPHLKADLTRFAHIDDGVLTCTLHGWQFELETGRCLTSDDRHLYTQKIDASGAVAEARSDGAVTHAPLEQPTTRRLHPRPLLRLLVRPEEVPDGEEEKARDGGVGQQGSRIGQLLSADSECRGADVTYATGRLCRRGSRDGLA